MPTPNKRPNIEALPGDIVVEVCVADNQALHFTPNTTLLHFFPDARTLDHIEVILPSDESDPKKEQLSAVFFDHHRLLGALAGTGHFTHLYHPGGAEV